MSQDDRPFAGPVEVDETYMGGKRKNVRKARREELTGRGPAGKTAVAGAKDRAANAVAAKVVRSVDKETLQSLVNDHAAEGAAVCADDAGACETLPFDHDRVKHSLQEYDKGDVHTNGIESLWSMLRRAHKGTFHKFSPKHLDPCVQEFAGRRNVRELDAMAQPGSMRSGMERKRLRYKDLVNPNGLSAGARA